MSWHGDCNITLTNAAAPAREETFMAKASTTSSKSTNITISSKNYSSWSLRGWLLVKFAKLDCK